MNTNIRRAAMADLAAIITIYNQTIPTRLATADTQAVSVESRLDWFVAHHERRPLLVVEIDNTIAGWVSLNDFYGRPAYHSTVELSIYVDDNFQGKGLGHQMITHCIKLAPALNITHLLGFVFSHNHASIRLLKTHGFKQWGQLPEIAEMDQNRYSLDIWGLKVTND